MKRISSLPILTDRSTDSRSERADIEIGLRNVVRGQVRFGQHDRALYATDASPYQVEPIGIVVPADIEDVRRVLEVCRTHAVPVLPRGGGTSLAGQCANRAVVVDVSALCRRVLSVDVSGPSCQVEPGIGIDELNRHLLTLAPGLFFAPDPATVAQATVGGCIGNNAAGARSIVYGRTSENILDVDVLLTTGERTRLGPGAGRRDEVARRLAVSVTDVVTRHADLIRARFAKTIRRNAGYGLDLVLKQLDAGVAVEDLDLSGLICGSEGTLAFVVGATLKLHPIRHATGLAIASFPTLEAAMDAVNPILTTRPSAVELLDDVVLRAALGNETCRPYVYLLPRATGNVAPMAVLYVEYQQDTQAEVEARFAALTSTLPGVAVEFYRDKPAMAQAWTLRKSGEALLHGLPGLRKPQTFVEDNAVPVEQLPRFVKEFKQICARHGTEAAYWAHASVGVLHVRPMINLDDEADLLIMKKIAIEVADLARACGGVMSGEHGDGRVRGPLLERFYGPEIMNAFREIKSIFDPSGILNPGNIVDAGPIDSITQNLRVQATPPAPQHVKVAPRTPTIAIDTYYDYADQDDFGHAVDACNGAGFCRKTSGGTMCPSYRGTLDERHSTRGRGNALRHAIRVGLGAGTPAWNDPETMETLDLCLSCKACKTECPSNVDVARLKAEYQAQSWKARGRAPLKSIVFGHVRTLNRLGSITPRLANAVSNFPPVRALMNRVLNISPKRSLPAFAPSLYRWFARSRNTNAARPTVNAAQTKVNAARPTVNTTRPTTNAARPKVLLYADCFATYNEPHVGRAAVRVLEACGYEVVLPPVACCGRAMMSTGLLPAAISSADAALATLARYVDDVRAIVVCEPSCLSAITDDWLQLKLKTPIELRQRVAKKSMLVEDFVDRFWDTHPTVPVVKHRAQQVVLHGHCHQKAVGGGEETSARLLRRLTGGDLTIIPSGCCGMAGSFGYAADKYDLSMAIGELSLFPPVRAAPVDATICAPGTSCRHQIHDGTGRQALHPIELAASLLCETAD